MNPLNILPVDIQNRWQASLIAPPPTEHGKFYLMEIAPTQAKSFQELRIIVDLIDENGFGLPDIPVAFAYSTADFVTLTPDFLWTPPSQNIFKAPTQPGGRAEQIQGSVVKEGQPGGITVFVFHPLYSSDAVAGAGALADHSGLRLRFQLKRPGVKSFEERLADLEAWKKQSQVLGG